MAWVLTKQPRDLPHDVQRMLQSPGVKEPERRVWWEPRKPSGITFVHGEPTPAAYVEAANAASLELKSTRSGWPFRLYCR